MTVAAAEADLIAEGASAVANVELDPAFEDVDGADDDITTVEDNDWHLSAATSAEITNGGINGAHSSEEWGFTDVPGARSGRIEAERSSKGVPWFDSGFFHP